MSNSSEFPEERLLDHVHDILQLDHVRDAIREDLGRTSLLGYKETWKPGNLAS